MKRLYEIDLLRIIAAPAVVIFHYTFSGWMQGLSPVSFPGLGEVSRYATGLRRRRPAVSS